MTNLHAERRRIAVATLASALLGAVLFVTLALDWPRPIVDWMRVIVPRVIYPAPAELALSVAAVLAIVTILLAVAILGARWLLRCLGMTRLSVSFALLLILAFALSFVAEAVRQVVQASGNLTASDATGLIIDNAQLTAHGWVTIARRAVVASLYAGVLAAAFWLVSSVQTRRAR
jgi:hypothetical protein